MKSLSVFRSAFNTVKTRYSFLTITALLMTAGVFVYYFYFLTSREDVLDERQFRVLNRIENRLAERLKVYGSLAGAKAAGAVYTLSWDLEFSDTARINKIKEDPSLLGNILTDEGYLDDTEGGDLIVQSAEVKPPGKQLGTGWAVTIGQSELSDSLLNIRVRTTFDFRWTAREPIAEIDFSIPVGMLIRPILRYDMFDEYMILKDGEIVYESTSSGLIKPEFDSAALKKTRLDGQQSIPVTMINGQEYRVYQLGFSMGTEAGWTLVGLKSADSFAAEKRTIPRTYLFAVFLFVLFIILSVPFIKSLIMSRTERLSSSDVVFSAVSLAVTTAVLSVLLMDGYLRNEIDDRRQAEQLVSLSDSVEVHLGKEISVITTELQNYASYIVNDSVMNGWYDADRYVRDWLHEYTFRSYPDFNNAFLVTTDGFTWYDYRDPDLVFDVADRPYVRELMAGRCMKMKPVTSPFYLDAVISWSEQQFRAVVSVPLPDSAVHEEGFALAAMSMRLRSLSNPLLPEGTGFSIFDPSGNVLFHSDSLLSLNENILEECGSDPVLRAMITGRTSGVIETEYSGTPCKMYVRPLGNLPYFIATFSRSAPIDAVHGQVFGMAFILHVLLFSFYIIIILAGLIMSRRRSRLVTPFFTLSAFIPDTSGSHRYLRAIAFNILHGLIIIFSALLVREPLAVILLLFISAPYTVLFNMLHLSGTSMRKFITGKQRLFAIYVIAVIIANIVSVIFAETWWILLAGQLLTIVTYLLIENKLPQWIAKRKKLQQAQDNFSYKAAYGTLVFVLALMTCVIPAFSFSITAYNKEKEIEVKTMQLSVLNQLNTQREETQRTVDYNNHYFPSFYGTYLTTESAPLCAPSRSELVFDGFSSLLRQNIQNAGELYNRLKYGAVDGRWTWCYKGDDSLVLNGSNPFPCTDGKAQQLISAVPFFKVPHFGNSNDTLVLRFWSAFVLSILLLYFILRYFVGKIFIHEKYSRTRSLHFDQEFFLSTDPGYKAYVTGMPSAGKSAYFRDLARRSGKIFLIDFVQDAPEEWTAVLSEAMKAGPGIVLLDHFEHDILEKTTTLQKLDIIEQLVANKDKKVVIISSLQPAVFLNMLDPEGNETRSGDAYRAYERWTRALAAFYDFAFPLQGYDRPHDRLFTLFAARLHEGDRSTIPAELVSLVETECDHGLFLRAIGVEMLTELHMRSEIQETMNSDDQWNEREDIIIRVQKLAENYYRSIWNHLAVEEQFVLYDLAQDGLVNPKNHDILESLIDKGLVVYNNKLRVMNRSFRNFILCVVGPSDLGKLDRQVRDAGVWGKLKLPLFLIVCSLLLFVVKSDRTQLFGYFTAFTAIIPIVVTVFGLFSQTNKKG